MWLSSNPTLFLLSNTSKFLPPHESLCLRGSHLGQPHSYSKYVAVALVCQSSLELVAWPLSVVPNFIVEWTPWSWDWEQPFRAQLCNATGGTQWQEAYTRMGLVDWLWKEPPKRDTSEHWAVTHCGNKCKASSGDYLTAKEKVIFVKWLQFWIVTLYLHHILSVQISKLFCAPAMS